MILEIVIAVIVAPVLFLNLIGPLIIRRTQKMPARVRFRKHDEATFMKNREEEFLSLDQAIRDCGFEHIGSSFMDGIQTETHFSLYTHGSDSSTAMVVSIFNPARSITYVEFSQLYADKSSLEVSNADQPSPFPPMDHKLSLRYPHIGDVQALHDVFMTLKAVLNNSAAPVAYEKDRGFEPVEEALARESDLLVSLGYCNGDIDPEGRRSLTMKGAYLMTWRSVFPGSRIKNAMDTAYARRLFRRTAHS
jgi:hypothetical protein